MKNRRQSVRKKLRFSEGRKNILQNKVSITAEELEQMVKIMNDLSREIATDFYSSAG